MRFISFENVKTVGTLLLLLAVFYVLGMDKEPLVESVIGTVENKEKVLSGTEVSKVEPVP